jgi:hypothetical protein
LAVGALFIYYGAVYSIETQDELRLIHGLRYDLREDFGYFFAGADMAMHGDADRLYPEKEELGLTIYPRDPLFEIERPEYENALLLARGNYYNPPALAFIQAPLTLLSFRDAFWIFSGAALAALGGFIAISWFAARGIAELPLLVLGTLAFKPVHEALILGHMTLFFVFILAAGFLLVRAQKPVLAGLTLSLLALKPQWAVLPGLFLFVRGEWRALATMFIAASAIFFSGFAVTGWHTFENYLGFLRFSAKWDINDAPHMFSWNGFLSRLNGSAFVDGVYYPAYPDRTLIYGLIALTCVPLLAVWYSRDYLLGAAAMVFAMLLISTHSVWYDWALLAVAALFMVMRAPRMRPGMRAEMWVVFVVLFVTTAQSIAEINGPDRHNIDWHHTAFFTVTPVAFASLLWLASVALREGLLRPRRAGRQPLRAADL